MPTPVASAVAFLLVAGCLATLPAVLPSVAVSPDRIPFELTADPMPVGPMAGKPVLADLNGDGALDVVIACGPCCGRDPDPRSGHVQILYNNGDGTLRPPGEPIKLLDSALGLDVADVNHDGHPDAVAFHHNDYRVGVLLGTQSGGLGEPAYAPLAEGESPHVHSVALADVDHDGHLDILASLVDDHALAVLLGDGRGGFVPAVGQPYFAHRHPYMQLNVSDVTQDGHLDVVLTDVRGGGLTVLAGSGTGMFATSRGFTLNAHTPITSAERPMAAAIADLDDDGDLDAVAVIDESPLAVVMMNTGKGLFAEHATNPVRLAVPTTCLAIGDVSGDGVPDLVTGGTTVTSVSVAEGNGDGTFATAYAVNAKGQDPSVTLGDMNGDGRLDIVTGNYDSGTVSVLLNRSGD